MDEFALIEKYFVNSKNQSFSKKRQVMLGIGDDAAAIQVDQGYSLLSCMDTLVAGVHFFEDCDAADLAYKALSVNLSDLAAMGAMPHSFTLSLTLPENNHQWLKCFSDSLFDLANEYELVLIGGDTTKGPLSITIQMNGVVEGSCFLKRNAADENDLVCVTGYLGLAALGLKEQKEKKLVSHEAQKRFLRPEARVSFAQELYSQGIRCAIDISDGLLSEVAHLCRESNLSAKLELDKLLVHPELQGFGLQEQHRLMLAGDDYELCVTVKEHQLETLSLCARQAGVPLSVIGILEAQGESLIYNQEGEPLVALGYKHF